MSLFQNLTTRVAALVIVGIVSASPVLAQTSSPADSMKTAQELCRVMNIDKMMDGALGQMWPSLRQNFVAAGLDAATIEELHVEASRTMREFGQESMKDVPGLYARHFSSAEMREMIAFYRTPLGQRALEVLPQIAVETMQMIQPLEQEMTAKLQANFMRIARQRGYVPSPAAAPVTRAVER